ncbi:hypothetical protein AB4Y90_05465 [Chryseobacterium sp. 2TAF14]
MPAANPTEAANMIDKTMAYDWKNSCSQSY